MITRLESALVPKSPDEPCADEVFFGEHVLGVADGATAKPWDTAATPTGALLAGRVAEMLAGQPVEATAQDAVRAVTELVAKLNADAGIAPGAGSAVTFAMVHARRREVWRIGDARVLVDGVPRPARSPGEDAVAAARALVLHEKLAAGVPLETLRATDPGRTAVEPLLRSLVGLRNSPDARFGYGAIDGTPVPSRFVEVLPLPPGACEVVLTTDGYPDPAPALTETERRLAQRLRRDPLLIEEVPATKGFRPGANSFDDRAYVRCLVS